MSCHEKKSERSVRIKGRVEWDPKVLDYICNSLCGIVHPDWVRSVRGILCCPLYGLNFTRFGSWIKLIFSDRNFVLTSGSWIWCNKNKLLMPSPIDWPQWSFLVVRSKLPLSWILRSLRKGWKFPRNGDFGHGFTHGTTRHARARLTSEIYTVWPGLSTVWSSSSGPTSADRVTVH